MTFLSTVSGVAESAIIASPAYWRDQVLATVRFGAAIDSIIGAGITLVLLFVLIPRMGYMGAAWTTLICYASMAVISYVWGQRHYPIPYNVSRMLAYMAGAVFLWWAAEQLSLESALKYAMRGVLLLGYAAVVWRKERGPLWRA